MNEHLATKLKNIPTNPGVYQFKNDKQKVLYVGKAKNLRNRVRSYFQKNLASPRIAIMVEKIADLEIIVTDSEIEALVLENNLIKDLKPRYNVNLKDDKSFPFIKVTKELYPRIYPTRQVIRDGSKYFGPYTEVRSMRNSLRMINEIFKIRSCKLNIDRESIDNNKHKICLEYHIKKCDGPCEGLISPEAYNEMVQEVIKLLKGKTDELIQDLELKMVKASEDMEFEKAAEIRDKLNQLQSLSERQKIVTSDAIDRDVIAVAYEAKDSACTILSVRNGKLISKKRFQVNIQGEESSEEIYEAVLKQYYNNEVEIPGEILVEYTPVEIDTISEWLGLKAERKVRIHTPQKGQLKSLINMCKENAILQLKEMQLQKMKKDGNVPYTLSALKRDLRLNSLPKKIECFDISNLQGSDTVASMVVFVDGKPRKSLYRKFIIKEGDGEPDDFASMYEVITRRYKRLMNEGEEFPNMIMVDGGKGQLSAAIQALKAIRAENFTIIGLAKRLEEIFVPGESDAILLPKTSSSLKLLQQIRDEAHRFAITFHRKRRDKRTFVTELTDIKGIGEKIATKLLKEFGSLEHIKNATLEKLTDAVGRAKAQTIYSYFNSEEQQ